MRKFAGSLAAALVLVTVASTGAMAADPPTPEAADQVVVRYRAGTTESDRQGVAHAYGLTKIRGSANGRTEIFVAKGKSPATARRLLAADPNVVAVSPNSWRDLDGDPLAEDSFDQLWGLHNTGQFVFDTAGVRDMDIDGLEALQIQTGRPEIVVAVIDDGVDFTHPDLAGTEWLNPGEIPNNSIDDDRNGFIDDVNGYNFCDHNGSVGPTGADGHGTHVAGTIAASLDGQGIVGVAPGVKVMALKAFVNHGSCGAGDAGIIEAIDYAAANGVPIINASWAGPQRSLPLEAAISDAAPTTLLVAAAGNAGQDMDGGGQKWYPAASTNANILTVAAIDQFGNRPEFSNYGRISVDISAPGTNIFSTVPPHPPDCPSSPCFAWADGTSMAAPHVSGVAALALSAMSTKPTPIALKSRILSSGVPIASVKGMTVTGRLVNALYAIDLVAPVAAPINRHWINPGSIIGTTVSTTMTWPAATDALSGVKSYLIKRSLGGAAWITLASGLTARSYKRTMAFGTPTRFQVFARDGAGNFSAGAIGPTVTPILVQDGSTRARYSSGWSTVSVSSASNGRLHRSTRGGASVKFTTTARSIAIVGRRGPSNGKARVYVDGVYRSTVNLRKSTVQSKVVVFDASWTTVGTHSVKVVVVGGTGRVEVDAFAFLR